MATQERVPNAVSQPARDTGATATRECGEEEAERSPELIPEGLATEGGRTQLTELFFRAKNQCVALEEFFEDALGQADDGLLLVEALEAMIRMQANGAQTMVYNPRRLLRVLPLIRDTEECPTNVYREATLNVMSHIQGRNTIARAILVLLIQAGMLGLLVGNAAILLRDYIVGRGGIDLTAEWTSYRGFRQEDGDSSQEEAFSRIGALIIPAVLSVLFVNVRLTTTRREVRRYSRYFQEVHPWWASIWPYLDAFFNHSAGIYYLAFNIFLVARSSDVFEGIANIVALVFIFEIDDALVEARVPHERPRMHAMFIEGYLRGGACELQAVSVRRTLVRSLVGAEALVSAEHLSLADKSHLLHVHWVGQALHVTVMAAEPLYELVYEVDDESLKSSIQCLRCKKQRQERQQVLRDDSQPQHNVLRARLLETIAIVVFFVIVSIGLYLLFWLAPMTVLYVGGFLYAIFIVAYSARRWVTNMSNRTFYMNCSSLFGVASVLAFILTFLVWTLVVSLGSSGDVIVDGG